MGLRRQLLPAGRPERGCRAAEGRVEHGTRSLRRDAPRLGYDIDARIADMDLDGVYATLASRRSSRASPAPSSPGAKDPELGLAALRAWNDWHIEEWAGPHPDRVIPLQLTWVVDPRVAARRRFAGTPERGFKRVSFPENPVDIGLPPMIDRHWDPFLQACEETETVVCLHNGSSSWTRRPVRPGAPLELYTSCSRSTLSSLRPTGCGRRCRPVSPRSRCAFSEGGISWVPMLIDRIDYVLRSLGGRLSTAGTTPTSRRPTRCAATSGSATIDIGSTFALRDHIGVDHICIESDYPHADSTWPDTQSNATAALHDFPRRRRTQGHVGRTRPNSFAIRVPEQQRLPEVPNARPT